MNTLMTAITKQTNDQVAEQSKRLKLLVASSGFGSTNQPWLWRQIVDLQYFQADILCWLRYNRENYPSDEEARVSVLPHAAAPYDSKGRWLYRLRNLPSGNFYASMGSERRELMEIVKSKVPDVILCYFGDIAMRMLPIARATRMPLVAYFHGDFQFVTNRWYRWSLKRCLKYFAAVVVVTEPEKRWMLEQGVPDDKLHIIPCGAPTEIFRPTSRMPNGVVRFVMASRLVLEKGCHISIQAFAHVAAEMHDVELQIYGDGPAREELQRLVSELSLNAKVLFHGYVNERILADSLPSFDVFIQHSLVKEGSPVSIMEAMACGLPVVSTPVGGILDQVVNDTTGLLIPEHDIVGMAKAMLRLARDVSLRQTFGRAGRERAVGAFDASHLTRRLEQVALDVAQRYRRSELVRDLTWRLA